MDNFTVTYLDPVSGGYLNLNNALVKAPPVVNKVNRLLKQPLGLDIQYPTEGNQIYNEPNFLTLNSVIQYLSVCLSPLIDNGELTGVNFINPVLAPNKKWQIGIELQIPNVQDEIIQWSNK